MNKELDKGRVIEFKEAVSSAIPVSIGYISVAIAFGLLSKNSGMTLLDTFFFSAILFAGASQFMAIGLITAGVSSVGIAISVFLLNLRLFVMATSMGVKTDNIDKKAIPIFGILFTDESFSVLSFTKNKLTTLYSLTVEIIPYLTWVIFSVLGYIIGNFLPEKIQLSLEIGLTALFIALLIPSVKKDIKGLYISLIGIIVYIIIFYSGLFSQGWDIVFGILISSVIGYILFVARRKK